MEKKKPKKKKNALPSGSYRVQALDYVDAAGKRHYRSFTAASKKEAQLLAEEWKLNKKKGIKEPIDLTVSEAVERYLNAKEAVLSPSTMKAYTSIRLSHLRALENWIIQVSRYGYLIWLKVVYLPKQSEISMVS